MKMRLGILAALALLLPFAAHAVETANPFRAGGNTHVINVTSTASNAEKLSGFSTDVTCTQYLLTNTGTVDAWVVLGAAATDAAAVSIPAAGTPAAAIMVRAGTTKTVAGPSQAYITTKTASSTTTLNATCGTGNTEAHTNVVTSAPPTGDSATQVEGNGADGAAVVGNAVRIAGTDGSGNTQDVLTGTDGRLSTNVAQVNGVTVSTGTGVMGTGVQRVAIASDNDALTVKQATAANLNAQVVGAAASGAAAAGNPVLNGGQYVTLANQLALSTGNAGTLQLDSAGNQKVTLGAPAIGNILVGRQTFTSTTGATTLITITAGKTWIGTINASVDCNSAAALATACKANATFTTVGANTTPAAGTYFVCQTTSGANAATGTVGDGNSNFCSTPFIASCASGSCTIAVASTNAGTASLVEASAIGVMQ